MRWKWIMAIIAAGIALLLVTIYVLVSRYDFNNLKPQIAQTVKDVTGRELTLGGDIAIKIGFIPALVVEDVRFQNAPWGSQPEMVTIRRLEVEVALLPLLRRNIDVKRLILVEPNLLVETDRSGKSNLTFEPAKKRVPGVPKEEELAAEKTKLSDFAFKQLRIEKGSFTYNDGESGRVLKVVLDSLGAEATGFRSPVELMLKGAYGNEPFEVEGTVGPLSAFLDHNQAWPLNLIAKIGGVSLTIDGTITDPLSPRHGELTFSAQGDDLAKVTKISGTAVPLKGPFRISGQVVDTAPKAYDISELTIMLGDSDLKGLLEINFSSSRLSLRGEFSSQKLDMRTILSNTAAPQKTGKPPKGNKKHDKVFPDDPLPMDALHQVDAGFKIQIRHLLLTKFVINDLSLEMMLTNGHLTMVPIKAGIGGGTLNGQVEIQSVGKAVAVAAKLKINELDLGSMFKEVKTTDALEGRFGGEFDLKGRGKTIAGLMGELNGTVIVMVHNGKIKNKYIKVLGTDLSSSLLRLLNQDKEKDASTEVHCFVSRLDIKDGFADCTVLFCDTDRMMIVGEGEVNLKTEKLNLSLEPGPKEGVGSKSTGKISLSLSELAKPFKLSGTLAHPSLALDPRRAAITLGKGAAGTALFGPFGIASALVSGSSPEENLCSAAVEAAQKGVKISEVRGLKEEEGLVDKTTEGIKEKTRDIGDRIKGLFGK